MSYTKLASSILTSTIWMESDHTRIVWLALLAMADKNGEVQASIPGLANIARVPVESCREAVAKLLAPDPDSRTKDDEGRRLEVIEGGWALLNHGKYRDLASGDDRAKKATERQRRHREKLKRNGVTRRDESVTSVTVTQESRQICQAEAEADTNSDTPRAPRSEAARREADRKLPESLSTVPFRAAWEKWCIYSADKNNGRPLPFATVDSHLETLRKLGPVDGVAAIENAIARNFREPAPPNKSKSRSTGSKPYVPR